MEDNNIMQQGPMTYRDLQNINNDEFSYANNNIDSPDESSELDLSLFKPLKGTDLAFTPEHNIDKEYQSSFLRNGEGDYFGKRRVDPDVVYGDDINHLQDVRAENQNQIAMGILLTIIIGALAGFLAGKIMKRSSSRHR